MDLLQSVGAWKSSVSNWQMNIAWDTALHNTTNSETLSVHHFIVQIIMFWKVMEEEEKEFKAVLLSEVSEMEENPCLFSAKECGILLSS